MTFLRRSLCPFLVAFVCLLAGCAGFGGPRVVTLSEADLLRILDRQMPFDRRLLEVVDVRIGSPRLKLLPEKNRLATEFDVNMSDRVFGKALNGRIALDYALKWDEQARAVRLADVRVGNVAIDGLTGPFAAAARGIGPLLAEQALEGLSIHRFGPDDLKDTFGNRVQPGAVTVTSRGVEITLQAAR